MPTASPCETGHPAQREGEEKEPPLTYTQTFSNMETETQGGLWGGCGWGKPHNIENRAGSLTVSCHGRLLVEKVL